MDSIWTGTFPVPSFPSLGGSARTDVCVVGAGIAGLSVAYMLTKAGRKVTVLDDGQIGSGETGRTTAHLTNVMDDRFTVLERAHGTDGLRKIVESHTAAIERIASIVLTEKIRCDLERVDGYLFLAGEDDEELLDDEFMASQRAGMRGVAKFPRIPNARFDSGPCLLFADQAQFHVLKYLAGLAQAIVMGGGRIYTDTHVASVSGGSPCRVETGNGHVITANAVCVCTNAPITDMQMTHLKQAPYRTCVIAAAVPRGTIPAALYWDTMHPYHYVRLQRLDRHDALIVGGEDFVTAHARDVDERWLRLERWMRERWPQTGDVIYRWSGQVFEPNDHVAFIGPNPNGAENVYMASGDSGQGMTHGTIAGMLLTDLLTGKPNDWASLYDPRRVLVRGLVIPTSSATRDLAS